MIRLSLDEVQRVLRLAASKGVISPTAGPTVGSVADAFGIQPMQVEALLNEVRAREAEAPQWRKLRLIGAAVGVFLLLGLSSMAWQAFSGGSGSDAEARTASADRSEPSNFAGASFSRPPASPAGENLAVAQPSVTDYPQSFEHRGTSSLPVESPFVPENRYAKTDATDIENSRAKAERYGHGALDYGKGGLPTGVHAVNAR